ncbi:hypothetical protein [Elizabethkingia ursingii]|uniref:hypothetical protein n=1 Tax=Elizabethkingia ursingii TaxID=1756150 RepID=UPI000750D6CA|nr:hypothetical protein [Elizabethkingia ursingii]KUY29394.1 hypothetical protein ATB96_18940 [Elizabethkingia ursingii]
MAITNNFKDDVVSLVNSFTEANMLDYKDAIVNDVVVDNEIEKEKKVLYGVKQGEVVPIIEKKADYTMFPVADESECGTNECSMDLDYSGIKWDLALIKCKIPICLNQFDKEFLQFWNTYKKFNDEPNMDEALLQYLAKQFKQGLENAKWRRAYFADSASTSPLLEGSDGFWIKADASAVVGENKIEITKNTGGTASAQMMTGEEVYNLLTDMYELATYYTWFDPSTFMFEVTWQMANAYTNWLNRLGHNAPTNCQCISPEGVVKSTAYTLNNIGFNGLPIKPRISFDGVISQVPELNGNNVPGAAKVSPNRALLVKNDNMLIGTSDKDQLSFFKMWHNENDEKIYMRGGAYLGAAFPKVDELILAI